MGKKKKSLYIVVHGRKPGIYSEWYGQDGAFEQVNDFSEAIYKGFYTRQEAIEWLEQFEAETLLNYAPNLFDLLEKSDIMKFSDQVSDHLDSGKVVIFTDGGAIDNPGPGGYGVVLLYKDHRRELSGGFRKTTNNRMEILACIEALRSLKRECDVILFSDSKYVVNAITEGWAERWRANGWMRSKKHRTKNIDLWEQLLKLSDLHTVEFHWVRGHTGNRENERCDELATRAAQEEDLSIDIGYEKPATTNSMPLFS